MRRPRIAFAAPAVLLLAATLGCATNPVTGRREISLVSPQQELQIGSEGYKATIAEYGAYDDSTLQRYVSAVGMKVARASHQPDLDWHFTVLDDPVINAFAMPGGYIYITRGILAHLNSEAQLAGVLGHECGHVAARHSAQQITKQELAGFGLGLASVLSESVGRYSGLAQQGLGLLFLKYSRDDETQADELGVQYATKAGYDPREIPKTYEMLARVTAASGQRLPFYLSTHPDPGNREERTRGLAQTAVAGKTALVVNGPGYVQRLQGVIFGDDPRNGYFDGDHYYHPTLRFEMTFPAGWHHQDSRNSVAAGSADQAAAMQLTLEKATGTPAEYVNALGTKGSISGADGRPEPVGGLDAWLGRVQVTAQDGQKSLLVAAFIRRGADQLFQVLGRSAAAGDDNERLILGAARSFRELRDPSRLDVAPQRVKVERVGTAGSFRVVVPKLGAQALALEQTSILNNRQLDDAVGAGDLIKIVVGGKRP